MRWEERLLQEAKQIVRHGEGKLELTVLPRKDKVSVRIVAGRSWSYLVENEED